MSPTAVETLRLTNGRVRDLMTRLHPTASDPALVNLQDFYDLMGELARDAQWLRGVSPASMLETEMAREVSTYRSSMEQLQKMLPTIERHLLQEKARLESEHSHLKAAADWADASKKTL
jgi:hypothetical protein